ncbi:MAG TPA: alpha/beta hydrolase, partial [Anaerolineaceae bacterium]|nr:alpha/beta hydrolase [Anaerolineaceae bacterium]
FETTPCPVTVPDGTVCGNLVVMENRANPASRTIRVAVVILKARSAAPLPDPIVYLEGGPGASAIEFAGFWAGSPYLENRDIILFEQRGTHYSDPFLDCPEVTEQGIQNFQRDIGFEAEIASEAEVTARCRDRLRAAGVDLSAYNSAAIAADLKDLRTVLGIQQWNLYGISYGTRAALGALRADPEGIRSVVLDSVYPPQYNSLVRPIPDAGEAFDRLFAACAADPECQAAYPNLRARFYALIERLDTAPLRFSIIRQDTGKTVDLLMTGGDVANLIFFGMYNADILPYVPVMVENLEQGRSSILIPLMDMAVQVYTMAIANGMYLSVECYDRAGMDDPALADQLAAAYPALQHFTLFRSLRANCAVWGAGSPDPAEYLPVESDVPALLLSGQFDPITPPAPAAETARYLAHSFHYVFPAQAHAVSLGGCGDSITRQFIDAPTREPDSSCIGAMPAIHFYNPEQLYATPVLYIFSQRVLASSDLLQLVVLGLSLVFLLVEVLAAPLRFLRSRKKSVLPAPRAARWARAWSGLAVLVNLGFLVGLVLVGFETLTRDSFMVAFGVPAEARALFWLPWAAPLLALGCLVCCAWLWNKRIWNAAARVQYTLLTLSLVALCWLYFQWGVFF